MYTYRLDATRDVAFLAEDRHDPVTQAPFVEGQAIVICSHCRGVFAASTWQALGKRCALCSKPGQVSETLQITSTLDLEVKLKLEQPASARFMINSMHPGNQTKPPSAQHPQRRDLAAIPPARLEPHARPGTPAARVVAVLWRVAVVVVVMGGLYGGTIWFAREVTRGAFDNLPFELTQVKTFSKNVIELNTHMLERMRRFGLPVYLPSDQTKTLQQEPPSRSSGKTAPPFQASAGIGLSRMDFTGDTEDIQITRIGSASKQSGPTGVKLQTEYNAARSAKRTSRLATESFTGYSRLLAFVSAKATTSNGDPARYRFTARSYDDDASVIDYWTSDWQSDEIAFEPLEVSLRQAREIQFEIEYESKDSGKMYITMDNAWLE